MTAALLTFAGRALSVAALAVTLTIAAAVALGRLADWRQHRRDVRTVHELAVDLDAWRAKR